MYFGGVDARALHQMVYKMLDHMLEEWLVGRSEHIEVELRDDGELLMHNHSDGLPVGQYRDTAFTDIEAIMQNVAGVHRVEVKPGIYQVHAKNFMGIGIGAVNTLCAKMSVQNRRDGFLWEQAYARGIPQTALSKIPLTDAEDTGTTFIFTPDYTIFEQNDFDRMKLARRLHELSYLNPGLPLTLTDSRVNPVWGQTFFAPEGLKTFVGSFHQEAQPLHDVVHIRQDVIVPQTGRRAVPIEIEIAFQFSTANSNHIYSYANGMDTPGGGMHLAALRGALLRYFNQYLFKHPEAFETTTRFTWGEIARGLAAAVSVHLPAASLSNYIRPKLDNSEVFAPVMEVVYAAFASHGQFRMEEIVSHFLARRTAPE